MPLLYGTGLPATGKSAVLGELRSRGHRAYGVDEDAYADWISHETGQPEDMPQLPAFDFDTWYQTHDWILSEPRITELSRQAADLGEPVFLSGVASGDKEVWHLFSAVIALVAARVLSWACGGAGRVGVWLGWLGLVLLPGRLGGWPGWGRAGWMRVSHPGHSKSRCVLGSSGTAGSRPAPAVALVPPRWPQARARPAAPAPAPRLDPAAHLSLITTT